MKPLRPRPAAPAAIVTDPGVQCCPGLRITRHAGIIFTDCVNRDHDMEKQSWLTASEVAGDSRMKITGMSGENLCSFVGILIRRGELYPVRKINERVILVADCAITDWCARQLMTQPLRHLAAQRAERVA